MCCSLGDGIFEDSAESLNLSASTTEPAEQIKQSEAGW